jgi:hypothetical protein
MTNFNDDDDDYENMDVIEVVHTGNDLLVFVSIPRNTCTSCCIVKYNTFHFTLWCTIPEGFYQLCVSLENPEIIDQLSLSSTAYSRGQHTHTQKECCSDTLLTPPSSPDSIFGNFFIRHFFP